MMVAMIFTLEIGFAIFLLQKGKWCLCALMTQWLQIESVVKTWESVIIIIIIIFHSP